MGTPMAPTLFLPVSKPMAPTLLKIDAKKGAIAQSESILSAKKFGRKYLEKKYEREYQKKCMYQRKAKTLRKQLQQARRGKEKSRQVLRVLSESLRKIVVKIGRKRVGKKASGNTKRREQ